MRLRRFEAATVAEALAQVKADLGPGAIILHAREAGEERVPPGGGRVEVMAAVDEGPSGESGVGRAAGQEARRRQGEVRTSRWERLARVPAEARQASAVATASAPAPHAEEEAERPEDARLEEIRGMLLDLRAGMEASAGIPAALRGAFRQLRMQEVAPEAARELLLGLPADLRHSPRSPDLATFQRAATQLFRVSGPIAPGRERRAVALVGPTGVGKTTTIAKLAGQLRHGVGLRVALVTLDTYRIGAMAQMQIYAELLSVPLHVVRSPSEMRAAIRAEADADLVLVDSMGRSPRHPEGINAVRDLLGAIPHVDVHLVLSATTKASDLEEILRRFRPLRYRHLLITKLDEARTAGPLLGLAMQRELPVSYLGTGQEVPDDLVMATPRRLASLLFPEPRAVNARCCRAEG